MAPNRDILAALDRLARAEDAFLRQEFLAPVVKGAGVAVRIAGVICRLKVEPNDFDGFGVFRPASHVRFRAATRWHDPAFPRAFPWFGEARFWERHIADLFEQLSAMDDPPILSR